MPELAETMRITEDLDKALLGRLDELEVTKLGQEWFTKKGMHPYHLGTLKGTVFWHAFGKQLTMQVEQECLTISMGMTGRFKLDEHLNDTDKRHTLFTMHMEHGKAHFIDYRKFFQIKFIPWERFLVMKNLSLLVCEHGSVRVNTDFHLSAPSKKPKITELLDEGKYTGIGNYLANEGLGRIGMDPKTPFKDYDEKRYLYITIQGIALESYATGGHSFNGGYIRPNGETGSFSPRVYGHPDYKRETFRGRTIYLK